MKIVVRIKFPSGWKRNYLIEALQKKGLNAEYTNNDINLDVEILITNNLSETELDNLQFLRYLIIPTSGTEAMPLDKLRERKIKIFQNKELISRAVVKYIIDMIEQLTGIPVGECVNKKTIGLLGFGNIGKGIYNRLSKYGCKFRVIKSKGNKRSKNILKIGTLEKVDDILSKSDVIINSLPLNKYTKGFLMNKTNLIKDGSIIVNVSRSGILNEKAILEGVLKGRFGGAILDSYSKNIDLNHYNHNNIILSPHIASIFNGGLENLTSYILKTVRDIRKE